MMSSIHNLTQLRSVFPSCRKPLFKSDRDTKSEEKKKCVFVWVEEKKIERRRKKYSTALSLVSFFLSNSLSLHPSLRPPSYSLVLGCTEESWGGGRVERGYRWCSRSPYSAAPPGCL